MNLSRREEAHQPTSQEARSRQTAMEAERPSIALTETTCRTCGRDITPKKLRHGALFCSKLCRGRAKPEGYSTGTLPKLKVAPSTRGAISELIVAADLMARGFHVFRALSPSCPCDLAVIKDGTLVRIEVRTGDVTKAGTVFYSTKPSDIGRHDVMAVVLNDRIIYKPEL